jgi:predicted enzyme related to lactoylglutathione lyase
MAGEIVHLEIPSRSFERSASFYAKLFGWRTDGQQAGGHLRFEVPAAAAAGGSMAGSTTASLVRSALAQATGPLPFVAVEDVDATLAEAERQGGRVLARRLPLAGHSQYGLLADVDGNVIAVVPAGNGAAEKGGSADRKKVSDDGSKAGGGGKAPAKAAKAPPPANGPSASKKAPPAKSERAAKVGAKSAPARKR